MADQRNRAESDRESASVHTEPAWGDVVKDGEPVEPPQQGTGPGDAGPSEEEIARRAYERYEQRGREQGLDVDDWLSAEQDLRDRISDEE